MKLHYTNMRITLKTSTFLKVKENDIRRRKTHHINKGDYFNIPENTPHGLQVLSSSPIKVLSIQSPKFDGTDRILINRVIKRSKVPSIRAF